MWNSGLWLKTLFFFPYNIPVLCMCTVKGEKSDIHAIQILEGSKVLPDLSAVPFGFRLAFKVQYYNTISYSHNSFTKLYHVLPHWILTMACCYGKAQMILFCRLICRLAQMVFFLIEVQLTLLLFTRSVVSDSLCPMDCSTPGFPVLHHPPELAQTHVHWISDAIQPSHPLSPPSPPAFNLSQHQGLFQRVSSSHQNSWLTTLVSGVQCSNRYFYWLYSIQLS